VFVLEAALESEWQPYWKSPPRLFGPSALCSRNCSPFRPGGASSYRASSIPSRTPGKRLKKAVWWGDSLINCEVSYFEYRFVCLNVTLTSRCSVTIRTAKCDCLFQSLANEIFSVKSLLSVWLKF
jgi:hypothetical protein